MALDLDRIRKDFRMPDDAEALISEIVQLRLRLEDAEQQASNAMTWQRAMVQSANESKRLEQALGSANELVANAQSRWRQARTKADRLRARMVEVKVAAGAVCPDFEMCDHPACAASYAVWHIADMALKAQE